MRDVGDVHPQPPAARLRTLDGNGVVEVAGIHRVDREDEAVPDIAAQRVGQRGINIQLELRCPGLDDSRQRRRQAKARHHTFDAKLGRILPANAPLDGHHAGLLLRGITKDPRRHDIAVGSARVRGGVVIGQHEEVVPDATVERTHGPQGPQLRELAHDRLHGPLRDLLHPSPALAARSAVQAHERTVTVHGPAQAPQPHPEGALRRLDHGATLEQMNRTLKAGLPPAASRSLAPARRAVLSSHAVSFLRAALHARPLASPFRRYPIAAPRNHRAPRTKKRDGA